MAEDKSLGPDGFVVQFYTKFWDLIKDEFTSMLQQAHQRGRLSGNMNHGLITLLAKGGDRELLKNWRPITLFNVSYKILAKALQWRLQPLLPDVISED
jgi:hypothetical protein